MGATVAWIVVISLLILLLLYSGVVTCVLLLGVSNIGTAESEAFELDVDKDTPIPEETLEMDVPIKVE